MLYSDEDRRDPATGRRHSPFFKPDWSPEHFLSRMYTGQLTVCRRDLVEAAGGLPSGRGVARLYDLMLRLVDAGARVEHLPRVLWHGHTPLPPTAAGSRRGSRSGPTCAGPGFRAASAPGSIPARTASRSRSGAHRS